MRLSTSNKLLFGHGRERNDALIKDNKNLIVDPKSHILSIDHYE